MTKPYRLTPKQWESLEQYADDCVYDACFLELRARIEALEAAQQKIRSAPESPLVECVADAIAAQATSAGIVNDRPARAAILEVAAWLRKTNQADWSVDQALFNLGECTYEDMGFEATSVIADFFEREANS